jgi:REP element-mobilizing transposase RayT
MPRTARLNVRGGIFHLISRFARDEYWLDRRGARDEYLRLIAAAATRTDAKILAYCLMSNHVHLVVKQGEEPLSRLAKSVHTGFAVWAHNSTGRKKAGGPVFAGRPRTVLVETDPYLLQLVRYVHNNPVRAKQARRARDSSWSSHRAYVGKSPAPEWLDTRIVLSRFARSSRPAFEKFVDEGRTEDRRPELSGVANAREAAIVRHTLGDGHRISDGVLGTDEFTEGVRAARERVEAKLSAREDREGARLRPTPRVLVDTVMQLLDVDAIEMRTRPKSRKSAMVKRLAVWTWTHEYQGPQIELARTLGLDTSVVSRYYAQAIENAGDFDEMATAVVSRLRRLHKAGKRGSSGALPVRYHVDVDEV